MDNLIGEFFGTMVLIVFGAGVCACNTLTKSKGQNGGWICITVGWGFAVTLGVFTATTLGAPQGDLNPAVTLAKTMIGIYTFEQFLATSVVQILGAMAGAAIVWLAYLPHWAETEDKAAKLGIFCTAPAIRNYPANILCEIIGTFFLVFVIWMIFQAGRRDSSRRRPVHRRRPDLGYRPQPRRSDGVCHQPGPRPRSSPGSCDFAHCRQRRLRLGICLGSRRRSDHRRVGSLRRSFGSQHFLIIL